MQWYMCARIGARIGYPFQVANLPVCVGRLRYTRSVHLLDWGGGRVSSGKLQLPSDMEYLALLVKRGLAFHQRRIIEPPVKQGDIPKKSGRLRAFGLASRHIIPEALHHEVDSKTRIKARPLTRWLFSSSFLSKSTHPRSDCFITPFELNHLCNSSAVPSKSLFFNHEVPTHLDFDGPRTSGPSRRSQLD